MTEDYKGLEGIKRESEGVTRYYKGLLDYRKLQKFTGDQKALQEIKRGYRALERFIGDHKGLQKTTRGY